MTPTSILIVIPTHNEELVLGKNVSTLVSFLSSKMNDFDWRVLIADNGSTDATPKIAERLAATDRRIRHWHIPESGRGRALRKAWGEASEDVLVYMDSDLATDLSALRPLVESIAWSSERELALGSRFAPGAVVTRSLLRTLTSRGYKLLASLIIGVRASDLQCGFKAIKRDAYRRLEKDLHDNEWFFDTELIARAERAGMKIAEIPVHWIEARDQRRKSTVKLALTALRLTKSLFCVRLEGRSLKSSSSRFWS